MSVVTSELRYYFLRRLTIECPAGKYSSSGSSVCSGKFQSISLRMRDIWLSIFIFYHTSVCTGGRFATKASSSCTGTGVVYSIVYLQARVLVLFK